MTRSVCAVLLLSAAATAASPQNDLDRYVSAPDPHETWFDTGVRVTPPLGGGAVAHILNVTSQQWLTEAKAAGPNGALWTHQVAVIVPSKVRVRSFAFVALTGGCNRSPKPPPGDEEYLMLSARIAERIGIVAAVVYQLPNCPIVYPSDPSRKNRSEDSMIAWAWRQYLDDDSHDPTWLPRFPMVKASFAAMRAAEAYTSKLGVADVTGWAVGGASKRGWTSWMAGVVECATCPKVVAITPLVPIVPFLNQSIRMQYRSLGGFTFAFRDYAEAGLLRRLSSPQFSGLLDQVDPGRHAARLARLPKLAVVSSDDEFMQLDWTSLGWSGLPGETHLLVVPNSEHSLITGVPSVLETLSGFLASVANGEGASARPSFTAVRNATSGALRVVIADNSPRPSKVVLRHTQTLSSQRRDFRWVRLANESLGDHCKLPGFKLKKAVEGGGNCAQPMVWLGKTLKAEADGSYLATPPEPRHGHYMGYYVELYYPSDKLDRNDILVSTPGHVWPDTFPYSDCDFSSPKCPMTLL